MDDPLRERDLDAGPAQRVVRREVQVAPDPLRVPGVSDPGQEVELEIVGERLSLWVRDRGPGFPPDDAPPDEGGMGLQGVKDRVESLGGHIDRRNRDSGGAELRMTLDLGGLE